MAIPIIVNLQLDIYWNVLGFPYRLTIIIVVCTIYLQQQLNLGPI